jgi:hypothetical protein
MRKIVLGVVTLAVAQSALAVENGPKNGSRELDPFAPAIVASARVCSEHPENAKYYQAAVKAVLMDIRKNTNSWARMWSFSKNFGILETRQLPSPKLS